jgi:hypothetical protein
VRFSPNYRTFVQFIQSISVEAEGKGIKMIQQDQSVGTGYILSGTMYRCRLTIKSGAPSADAMYGVPTNQFWIFHEPVNLLMQSPSATPA